MKKFSRSQIVADVWGKDTTYRLRECSDVADASIVPVAKRHTPWQDYAPGQDEMGYGCKITTDYMLTVDNKQFRVYCCCISNAASHYIHIDGKDVYLSW